MTKGEEVGFGERLIAILTSDIVVEVEIREARFEGFHLDRSGQFVHFQGKVPVKATASHPVTLFLVIPQPLSPPLVCVSPLFGLVVILTVLFKQEPEKLWWRQVRLEEGIGIVVIAP